MPPLVDHEVETGTPTDRMVWFALIALAIVVDHYGSDDHWFAIVVVAGAAVVVAAVVVGLLVELRLRQRPLTCHH